MFLLCDVFTYQSRFLFSCFATVFWFIVVGCMVDITMLSSGQPFLISGTCHTLKNLSLPQPMCVHVLLLLWRVIHLYSSGRWGVFNWSSILICWCAFLITCSFSLSCFGTSFTRIPSVHVYFFIGVCENMSFDYDLKVLEHHMRRLTLRFVVPL